MFLPNPTGRRRGIPGSTLKIIAIVTMFLDHIGASLLESIVVEAAWASGLSSWSYGDLLKACPEVTIPYLALRLIGRVAFPIFCFLLVEGFLHTRDVKRYAARLAVFALVSEIPFDLAIQHQAFYPDYQNVFFTLFVGLVSIAFLDLVDRKLSEHRLPRFFGSLVIIIAAMLCAELLFQSDYGAMGVLTIVLMYRIRENRIAAVAGGCVCLIFMSFMEFTSLAAVPLVARYNGERGIRLKYFFYAFYPVHLFLLYLVYHFFLA